MESYTTHAPASNPAPAQSWPGWTDLDRWEPTAPDADDAQWAAQSFGSDFDSDDDEPLDEGRALESYAMDSLESGLIGHDLADALSRSSLVGHPA